MLTRTNADVAGRPLIPLSVLRVPAGGSVSTFQNTRVVLSALIVAHPPGDVGHPPMTAVSSTSQLMAFFIHLVICLRSSLLVGYRYRRPLKKPMQRSEERRVGKE